MNRRHLVVALIVVAIGLTGLVAAFAPAGLSPNASAPADAPAESTSAVPGDTTAGAPADDDGNPYSDAEIAEHTRIVSSTKPLTVTAADGEVIRGMTPLAAGTELTVRVRSDVSAQPFVRSVETTVEDDGTFRGTFDLSTASPGTEISVAVHHDGRELARRTAVVEAAVDGTALDYDGDRLTVRNEPGQLIRGTTDLEPGTEVRVRLHSGGDQAFVKQRMATVRDDGRFAASFDFTDIEPGMTFRISVAHDGDRLTYVTGEVAGSG